MNMQIARILLPSTMLLAACGSSSSNPSDPAPATPIDTAPVVQPSAKPREVFVRSPFGRTEVADNLVLDGDFEFTGRSGQMPWLIFTQRGQATLAFETGGRCVSGIRCAKLPPGTTMYGWLASPASGRFTISLRGKPSSGRCSGLAPMVVDFADGTSIARLSQTAATPDATGWCTYAIETDAFSGKESGIYIDVNDKDTAAALIDDAIARPVTAGTPGNPIAGINGYSYVRHEVPTGVLADNLRWLGDYLKSHRTYGRSTMPLDNPPRAKN